MIHSCSTVRAVFCLWALFFFPHTIHLLWVFFIFFYRLWWIFCLSKSYRNVSLSLSLSPKKKKSISGSGWEASSLLGTNHKPTLLLRRNCFQMEAKIEEGLHCCRIHRRYFWHRHPFRFVRFNIQEHSSPVSTKLSRQNAARRFLKEVELKTGSEAVSHSEWSVRSCSQDTRAGWRRVGLMVDGIHVSCEESVLILLCLLQTMWTVMSSFKIIICHTAWYPSNIYITRCSPCQKIL